MSSYFQHFMANKSVFVKTLKTLDKQSLWFFIICNRLGWLCNVEVSLVEMEFRRFPSYFQYILNWINCQ